LLGVNKAMDAFEATWYPRIGKDATKELRRFRKTALLCPAIGVVCSWAAGLLVGSGSVGDAIGLLLAAVAAGCCALFVGAQWRTAAAVSVWFGVPRRWWLPRMNPARFDEWRTANGFRTPDERRATDRSAIVPREK
jgi:hypothetical protein